MERAVFIEEFQTGLAVDFRHIVSKLVSTAEDFVEFVIPEADQTVIFYCTSIINLVNVGPHTCAEAHVAWFAGCVQRTS